MYKKCLKTNDYYIVKINHSTILLFLSKKSWFFRCKNQNFFIYDINNRKKFWLPNYSNKYIVIWIFRISNTIYCLLFRTHYVIYSNDNIFQEFFIIHIPVVLQLNSEFTHLFFLYYNYIRFTLIISFIHYISNSFKKTRMRWIDSYLYIIWIENQSDHLFISEYTKPSTEIYFFLKKIELQRSTKNPHLSENLDFMKKITLLLYNISIFSGGKTIFCL